LPRRAAAISRTRDGDNCRQAKPDVRDARGIALPMALGFVMVVSISLVTVLELSLSGQRSSKTSDSNRTAFAVAEAGLNHAQALLAASTTPTSPSVLPSSCGPPVSAAGGTFCYWGTLSGSTWTVYARGTVRNPGGGASLTHEVSQQVSVSGATATVADNPAWGYLYSDSPTGCMTIQSSVQIRQKLYVKGDLCLDSSAQILAEAAEVSVGGEITLNSAAWIGQGTPLPVLNVGSTSDGCRWGMPYSAPGGGPTYAFPCNSGHHVNATAQNHTIPNVSKPPIDLAARYADASPGPNNPCTTQSGSPPVFDTNTTMDNTTPAADIIGAAYSCSTPTGSISWAPGSPGMLTISGTIFFDGDIVVSGSERARVVGRGTIYTSGQVRLDSSVQICSVFSGTDCNFNAGAWDPDESMLTLVAGSGTPGLPSDQYAVEINSSVRWQGGLYAVGDFLQTSSAIAQGPVIARQIYYDSSTGTLSAPFANLTPGAPGSSTTSTIAPVPGSWRG
jgi:Tfp pilus assembly protein PilX